MVTLSLKIKLVSVEMQGLTLMQQIVENMVSQYNVDVGNDNDSHDDVLVESND